MPKIALGFKGMLEVSELLEIKKAGILSINKIGLDDSMLYIEGEGEDFQNCKWMAVCEKIEDATPVTLEEIGDILYNMYIRGQLTVGESEGWIDTLTKLVELAEKEV